MSAMVYVSIGSNVEAEKNIRLAVAAIRQAFGELVLSPVYESAAVGFDGDDFLNLVTGFETTWLVSEVVSQLHMIEDDLGRDRTQARFSKRPIDLDILLYDDLVLDVTGIQIPRHEIMQSPYVLKPLSDIAPNLRHPLIKQSYETLWLNMAPDALRLDRYDMGLLEPQGISSCG